MYMYTYTVHWTYECVYIVLYCIVAIYYTTCTLCIHVCLILTQFVDGAKPASVSHAPVKVSLLPVSTGAQVCPPLSERGLKDEWHTRLYEVCQNNTGEVAC